MRRSHFLKYASILMMLIALVRFFFGLSMINFFTTAMTFGMTEPGVLRLANFALTLILLGAAAELACGFLGAIHWEEPLKAGLCVGWGAAALLLGLAGNLVQNATGYGISYVAWTTGAIVPALYLAAALHFYLRSRK